jgi:hypothetical protein
MSTKFTKQLDLLVGHFLKFVPLADWSSQVSEKIGRRKIVFKNRSRKIAFFACFMVFLVSIDSKLSADHFYRFTHEKTFLRKWEMTKKTTLFYDDCSK